MSGSEKRYNKALRKEAGRQVTDEVQALFRYMEKNSEMALKWRRNMRISLIFNVVLTIIVIKLAYHYFKGVG